MPSEALPPLTSEIPLAKGAIIAHSTGRLLSRPIAVDFPRLPEQVRKDTEEFVQL